MPQLGELPQRPAALRPASEAGRVRAPRLSDTPTGIMPVTGAPLLRHAEGRDAASAGPEEDERDLGVRRDDRLGRDAHIVDERPGLDAPQEVEERLLGEGSLRLAEAVRIDADDAVTGGSQASAIRTSTRLTPMRGRPRRPGAA